MTPGRAKISTSLWDDEDTLCYQIDVGGICVTRRQDNDMVNGTKLLNVTGMSRGKRDGILKNEKGRVVVKLGAMHLKGVWVTFSRAKHLATHFNILDQLYPLFADDPAIYFLPESLSQSYFNYIECEAFFPRNGYHIEDNKSGMKRDDHKTRPMNNSSEMMNVSMIHNQMPIDYSPVFQVMDNSYHSDCSLTYQSSPHSLYQQDLSPSIPVAPTMIPFQTPMYNYKQLPTTPQYEHLYGNV
ncbi:transcription regulator HTH, apses-type DNA-binding domain-containing protein [Pilobolus umbonatus]|nr:transcription regulator HTH, apses-type DNA-binding domain-containing protein [Pilobolus umbonatus]